MVNPLRGQQRIGGHIEMSGKAAGFVSLSLISLHLTGLRMASLDLTRLHLRVAAGGFAIGNGASIAGAHCAQAQKRSRQQ
jgi:predicted ABC-type ATPase